MTENVFHQVRYYFMTTKGFENQRLDPHTNKVQATCSYQFTMSVDGHPPRTKIKLQLKKKSM